MFVHIFDPDGDVGIGTFQISGESGLNLQTRAGGPASWPPYDPRRH
jgi:hypothetical protein